MAIQILDGTGTGQSVGVSPTGNRLNVSSRSDERIYYISRDNGDAYTIYSRDAAAAADEHQLYFRNTSTTKKFYVNSFELGGADICIFSIIIATGTATGGSTLTPVNLNFTSGNTASATVLGNGDVGGFTTGAVIRHIATAADTTGTINFHDSLVLGQGDAIAVHTRIGGTGEVTITMTGFYDIE